MATSVTAGDEQIIVSVDNPGRDDLGGLYIWRSTSSGFTPGPTNLVYNGPDLVVRLGGVTADVPYYLKMALYSAIDPTDYTVSSEYTATPFNKIDIIPAKNGSAAAPSHSFRTSPDMGMYKRGANGLGFATEGVERIWVDADGLRVSTQAATDDSTKAASTAHVKDVLSSIGLGDLTNTPITNLDNDTTLASGVYDATGTTTGTNPVSAGHVGTVYHIISGASGSQIFISKTTGRLFVRGRTSSTWGSWVEIARLADVQPLSAMLTTLAGSTAAGAALLSAGGILAMRTYLEAPGLNTANDWPVQQVFSGGHQTKAASYGYQGPVAVMSAGGVIAAADVIGGIIRYTGLTDTLTTVGGANIDSATGLTSNNQSFDLSINNTGGGTVTLAFGTGVSSPFGSMDVVTGTSGLFRFRKSGTATYLVYRIA